MLRNRTVVLISNDAVDKQGKLGVFPLQELPWLTTHFERVLLVCRYGTADILQQPMWQKGEVSLKRRWIAWFLAALNTPFRREFWQEICRMKKAGRWSFLNFLKLAAFAVRGQKMRLLLSDVLQGENMGDVTLYAYWMSYDAYAAALIKQKKVQTRLLVRGHAFDIDPHRNSMNPYLMKHYIATQADAIYPISEYAKDQYLRYMQDQEFMNKLHVVGVGASGETVPATLPPRVRRDTLLLVSCANISEIKQLPLLIDALALWEGAPLHWLHLGGGPDEDAVREYAKEKLDCKSKVTYFFTGHVSNQEIQETYQRQAFDAFVNTSRLEGTPVSIMEAMRFGIPVIAPRVGGIAELVSNETGILYDAQEGPQGVKDALTAFFVLPEDVREKMRKTAQYKWMSSMRQEVLLPHIFREVESEEREG